MTPNPYVNIVVITEDIVLENVDHILMSGVGVLDFSVSGEDSYYTWRELRSLIGRFLMSKESKTWKKIVSFSIQRMGLSLVKLKQRGKNEVPVDCYY